MKLSQDSVPLWIVILIILGILLVALIVTFVYVEDIKATSLVGGLIGGLVVYIANFISERWAWQKLFAYQRMGVRNLLSNRHDKSYYRNIISNASIEVKVMGASCSRFIDDFMDIDSDDKVLIDGLRRHPNLVVKMLIPNDDHINDDARQRFLLVSEKLVRVGQEFNERVQLRRFAHKARHSFVISDDELIAGPIFSEEKSKHAPAVHVDVSTDFGKKYFEYFDRTWEKCKVNG